METRQVHLPAGAQVGLEPNVHIDTPVSAVLLPLYLVPAIMNQVRFQLNRRRGHKFIMSWAMFGFAMTRVVTLSLRIAYACVPDNISLGVASVIFTHAGLLVMYLVNFMLAWRILRALQPKIGWSRWLKHLMTIASYVLAVVIFAVIALVIADFYSYDTAYLTTSSWITRAFATYILAYNMLGVLFYAMAILLPTRRDQENFGIGSMRAKLVILGVGLFFIDLICIFRTGVAWVNAPPVSDPAWFDSRGCFYGIELGFEIVTVWVYTLSRFERRFWVPDKSHNPGDYSSKPSPLDTTVEQVEK